MPWPVMTPEDSAALAAFVPADIMHDSVCHWIGTLPQDRAIACMQALIKADFHLITGDAMQWLIAKHAKRIAELHDEHYEAMRAREAAEREERRRD